MKQRHELVCVDYLLCTRGVYIILNAVGMQNNSRATLRSKIEKLANGKKKTSKRERKRLPYTE